ncbi:TRAP transporter substrate-binding protein [Hominifimenecus sp. rT4P-3]|uniref:TRAP transporter substrate-binding protein n=1 Tax=Hominifimenecus sp. rT4P-3 TaxID=3242979 RepID=UPI003DA2A7B0
MKRRNQVIAMVLSSMMVLSLAACGNGSEATTAAANTTAAAGTTAAEATTAAEKSTAADTTAAADASAFENLEPVNLTVASAASSANMIYNLQVQAAEEVKEKSGGKLNIEVVWDGSLGNDNELINSCIMGDVDMAYVATSSLSTTCPQAAIFDIPSLFDDIIKANNAVAEFAPIFDGYVNEYGMKILGLSTNTFRGLSTNTKIEKPEDFKGMSIRCPENKYYQAYYENLGCNPTPLAFSELFVALQQGLVQAQDNPAQAVAAMKFYEVQDYYMDMKSITYVFPILMNLDTYNSLDPAYQSLLVEFAERYGELCRDTAEEDYNNSIQAMEGQIEVLPVTDEIRAAIVAAGEPIVDMVRADLGDEIVDQYLAIAESANK